MAWLTMILALMTPMALELLWRGLKRDLRPTLTEILQERIRKRKRNEIKIKKGNTEKNEEKEKPKEEDNHHHVLVPENHRTSSNSVPSVPDENLTHEDESKFYSRKVHRTKGDTKLAEGHVAHAQSYSDGLLDPDENLKRSVVRAMLRFRNITGSTFDSAAQAKYQAHDTMETIETKERKGESKEEVVRGDEDLLDEKEQTLDPKEKEKKKTKKEKRSRVSKGDEGDT